MISLARELGWSIRDVEELDGSELDEWRAHFATRPFTVDMLDFIGAHICQSVVQAMGGKRVSLEKFLLIKRGTKEERARRGAEALRAALGG